uniref:Putative head tail adaptor n=1 Tax=Myoviridae sp. ctBvM24 TaxID=2825050 RepID=A0A8S5UD58_9CAUD|nr:MAG TPA: putative head tail adaptor [Myoviridae sp. ctBvM24]
MGSARIKIYKRQYAKEAGRLEETEPILYYTCWCEIGNLYGNELYKAIEIRLKETAVFEVRYCQKIKEVRKHLKDYLIEYDGERYELFGSDSKKGDKQRVLLKANCIT